MNLLDIEIASKEIPLGNGQSLTVSGISATQVFGLYQRHKEELATLFDQFSGRGDYGAVLNTIEGIIASFPMLVSETIALATGINPGDEAWERGVVVAGRLPMAAQIEVLFATSDLSFTPEMPPKKFFGLLVGMIQQATSLTTTLGNGSGN